MAVDYSLYSGRPDPYGFNMPYETEEDRRKRLEREALAQGQTPGGPVASTNIFSNFATNLANAPQNFVDNVKRGVENIANAPQNFVNNVQDIYNRNIAQQESGNRPDIGYHDRQKSTAYGPYGMTAAAYQDARRLNPNLPEDITQAKPEQLTQAQNAYTQQNASYLRNYGVEPTQNNLAAAHFLGAKGLSDYLKTGYISPQAAQANGGEENVRRIINARLGGQQAPASGAVNQPVPPTDMGQGRGVMGMPVAQPGPGVQVATGQGVLGTQEVAPQKKTIDYINQYQEIQDNPQSLMNFGFDDTVPEYLRNRAKQRAGEILNTQDKLQQAQNRLPTMGPRELADAAQGRDRGGLGDWLQYLLFKHVGLNDLANEKGEKLGIGTSWQNATIVDDNGKERSVEVLTSANGKILKGQFTGPGGATLTRQELEKATGQILGKGVHISKTETYVDPTSGQVVNHQTLSNGRERWTAGGQPYTGDKTKLVLEHAFTANENTRVNTALRQLESKYPVPTQDQKYEALVRAGVPPRRIETELGLQPGALNKPVAPQPQAQPGNVRAPASYLTPETQPMQGTQPSPKPTNVVATAPARGQPDMTAQYNTVGTQFRNPIPGESKEAYDAAKRNFESGSKLDIKRAEEFSNKAIEVRDRLQDIKQAVEAVQSGNHYFGPLFGQEKSKVLPGVQEFVGGKFGDQTSMNNTTLMRSLMTREGLNGIKNSMGPSISNFDVQSWLRSNPVQETSSPEQLLQYYTKLHNQLYDMAQKDRANAIKHGQLSPDFDFGQRLPDFRTNVRGPEKKKDEKVDTNNPLLR